MGWQQGAASTTGPDGNPVISLVNKGKADAAATFKVTGLSVAVNSTRSSHQAAGATKSSSRPGGTDANDPPQWVHICGGSTPVTLTATTDPPGQAVDWAIKNFQASKTNVPALSAANGTSTTLPSNMAGSFVVSATAPGKDGNSLFYKLTFVNVTVDPAKCTAEVHQNFSQIVTDSKIGVSSGGFFSDKAGAAGAAFVAQAGLTLDCDGDSVPAGQVVTGFLQNITADSATGNFENGGTEVERPKFLPMLDCSHPVSGGQNSVIRDTNASMVKYSQGGDTDGTRRTLQFCDSPQVGFLKKHKFSGKDLTSISGSNSFRTALASFTFDSSNSITVHAVVEWTVDFGGNVHVSHFYNSGPDSWTATSAAATVTSPWSIGTGDAADKGFEAWGMNMKDGASSDYVWSPDS